MNYRRAAREAALRHRINPRYFKRQIGQESGFDPNVSSPAGARGIAQIMPDTARGWGVDPMDPLAALDAAAEHMAEYIDQYGGWEAALRAYNAGPGNIQASHGFDETNNYVQAILRGANPGTGGGGGTPATSSPAAPDSSGGLNIFQTIADLSRSHVDENDPLQQLIQGNWDQMAQMMGQQQQQQQSTPPTPGNDGNNAVPPTTVEGGDVTISDSADRAGVSTKPAVINFAKQVSAISGIAMTLGTGTNHSQMTVNGNQSQHWTGDAGDFPATGNTLIRLGQAALIAAGMPEQKAKKQRGGLYNVGGYQIIFNTHEGGDHTNHLHIGI